ACAAAGSLALVYSEQVAEEPRGDSNVEALATLALLTGRIGQARSGIHPLCRHINTRGAADMGMRPNRLPGDLPLSEEPGRTRLAAIWDRPTPAEPGSELAQLKEMARRGELKGLYLLGGDCLPGEDVRALSAGVEFLVVQDFLLRDGAEGAHVVLPAATFLEQEGSFTDSEGRVRRLHAVKAAPDHALPDWRIPADLLARLQPDAGYEGARAVAREIACVVPYFTEPV
ncbi:MAG: formate dehydrogenase subunit alpha, partial [Desulfobacteraceae bacterium]